MKKFFKIIGAIFGVIWTILTFLLGDKAASDLSSIFDRYKFR